MKQPFDLKAMLSNLKVILKNRKITYRELGQGIGLSESGVKKLMSSEDISLKRLSEICELLGTSIVDMIEMVKPRQIEVFELNELQQKYFIKNFDAFKLYFLLVYERMSFLDASHKLSLTKAKGISYLKKLDDFKLVTWEKEDQIKIAPNYTLLKNEGPLLKKVTKEWGEQTLRDAQANRLKGDLFTLRLLKLSRETQNALQEELQKLINHYEKLSLQEVTLRRPEDIVTSRILLAHAQGSFI